MTDPEGRIPPHSARAECALLGAILLDTRVLDSLAGRVIADDFYSPALRTIFAACRELHDTGTPANIVTVTHRLREHGVLDTTQVGGYAGAALVAWLSDQVPSAHDWEAHARIVADLATRRRLIDAAGEWGYRAADLGSPATDLLDAAETAIMALRRRATEGAVHVSVAVEDALSQLAATATRGDGVTGLATGLTAFDRQTGGLERGDLWLLAGRPGTGKTAWGLQVAARCAVHDRPAAVFSLEMPRLQLAQRLLAGEARVNQTAIRTARLSGDQHTRVLAAATNLCRAKLFIDDSPALFVGDLRARARRLVSEHEVGFLVVDYLQLMRAPVERGNREREIAAISQGLKALAKELKIPVLAITQMNRAVEQRTDKRPVLSDLRESGSQEQDADGVVFVYRPILHDAKAEPTAAELIIAKQRNGPTGSVPARFLGEWTRFENPANEDGYAPAPKEAAWPY